MAAPSQFQRIRTPADITILVLTRGSVRRRQYAETLQQMLKELDAAHEEGLIERHSLLSLRERVQRVSDAAISEKRVREACLALTPKPWP